MMETPSIGSTMYAAALGASNMQSSNQFNNFNGDFLRSLQPQAFVGGGTTSPTITQPQEKTEMADTTRLVKVFIVDPNANLPLENRLIYSGDEKITDLTDQELFFEIDINGLLSKHNEVRTKTEDKKANKDKPVYLEAARVRDLKMQVVVLAQF